MAKDILYPLRWLHGRIQDFKMFAWPVVKKRFLNPNAIFLVLTPEHVNLGDHAIAKAEIQMLQKLGISYIEIPNKHLEGLYYTKWLRVLNGTPILITGGGNLGTLWFGIEKIIREIIKRNPGSEIAILPNTFYYEDSPWGREELEKSKKIYNGHKHLRIYAREKTSFVAMTGVYHNVKLIPDMVLSLNACADPEPVRKGCILCLRWDIERTLSDGDQQIILRQAKELFGEKISRADTMIDHPVSPDHRDEELEKQFDLFRHAELVITDRLHGMIFCAITGTPCIVVDSKSHKVRGCYEWIQNLDYIRFAEDVSDISREYQRIPQTIHKFDNTHLLPYYDELAREILKMAVRE